MLHGILNIIDSTKEKHLQRHNKIFKIGEFIMINGEKIVDQPIRWAMIGGGRGSQIGYIHRSAALRDANFELVAGAFDVDPERGKDFGINCHVDPDRCYPDYKTLIEEEAKRPDGIQAVSIATRISHILKSQRLRWRPVCMFTVRSRCASRRKRQRNWKLW